MTTFILIAAAMAAAAIAFVAWPLYRARTDGRGATGTVIVVALAIPLVAFLLYSRFSNWDWSGTAQQQPEGAHSMEQAVAMLEAKLAQNPEDVQGWMLLGRTRMATNEFPQAVKAYEEAYRLTGGKDADVIASYAEALAVADETALKGRAAELFDAALAIDPANQRALWYGGLAALGAGKPDVARDRWAALAAQNPPPEVKAILDERVAELDRQQGRAPAAPGAAATSADAKSGAPAESKSPAPAAGSIPVKVTVAPALAGKIPPSRLLFVLARDPSQPGPPLAAKRIDGAAPPVEIVLTAADSMAEGRTIAGAKQLTIVARYSTSGMPMASSGDPFGEARYDAGQGKPVEIVIDRTVP